MTWVFGALGYLALGCAVAALMAYAYQCGEGKDLPRGHLVILALTWPVWAVLMVYWTGQGVVKHFRQVKAERELREQTGVSAEENERRRRYWEGER